MQRSLFTTSAEAWEVMLRAIAGATKSIYLEMYIFLENGQGHDFVAALEERARAGVRVVVVLDAVGSYELSADTRTRLIQAGVEVMYYRYWFHRTHRKLLLVDEHVAFVGGVNIGERFRAWDDLVVRVQGTVVLPILHSFARAYVLCGGTDPVLTARAQVPVIEKTRTWFVEHGLGGAQYVMRRAYLAAIDSAEERIVLVTPYFVPGSWLIAALGRALKRGVAVTVIVPAHTDMHLVDRLSRYYADMLTQLGARFYVHPRMLHAKTMLIDAARAVVGSQNLDTLSFDRNVEAGVFFETPRMVRELQGVLERWVNESTPFSAHTVPSRWYDRVLIMALRLVRPVL